MAARELQRAAPPSRSHSSLRAGGFIPCLYLPMIQAFLSMAQQNTARPEAPAESVVLLIKETYIAWPFYEAADCKPDLLIATVPAKVIHATRHLHVAQHIPTREVFLRRVDPLGPLTAFHRIFDG
ncbi:hypothetical protein M422DRAFT_250064 [Sphaerobolus stellatus SS14]|nr:hypothetical protein M422DRAFT_250064 [Sphaerobolus stellatus SS14]